MAPKSAVPKTGAKSAPKKRAASPGAKAAALPTEDIKRFKSFVQAEAKRGAKKNPQTDALSEAYDQSDREGKREILEKWSGDRSLGWVAGYLQEKAFVHSQGSETRSSWQTEAAICAQEGLGNLEHISEDNRKVLDELLSNREVRVHEYPALAALGLKQYRTKKTEEVEASLEQDAVRLTLGASGVQQQEQGQERGRRSWKGSRSPTPPSLRFWNGAAPKPFRKPRQRQRRKPRRKPRRTTKPRFLRKALLLARPLLPRLLRRRLPLTLGTNSSE